MATTTNNSAGTLKTLANVLEAVTTFHNKTGDPRMQTSTMMCFLYIAMHGEVPQQDLIEVMNVESKTSVTRALQSLGKGTLVAGQRSPGLGWVIQEEDPFDGKRKIVRLSPAGQAVVRAIEKAATKY